MTSTKTTSLVLRLTRTIFHPERLVGNAGQASGSVESRMVGPRQSSFFGAALIVGDGVSSRPGQQNWVGGEIDAVRQIGGIEHQAAFFFRAR